MGSDQLELRQVLGDWRKGESPEEEPLRAGGGLECCP